MDRATLLTGILCTVWAAPAIGRDRAAAAVELADQHYNRALERADVATLRAMIDDNYVFTDPAGRVSNRDQVIEGIASGHIVITSQITRDARISVFGDAAVETGILTSVAMRDGRNSGGTFRFTRVWVKRAGRWITAAFQETGLASETAR